ncbi:MAG: GNAT family N-acetyltransferase [Tenuifilaceae bacterium]
MIKIYRVNTNEVQIYSVDPQLAERESIPISRHRAMSYSANPRSSAHDVVLYLAYKEEKLIGYRTVLPDYLFIGDQQLRIGWLSGNWVHEKFRRQGVAMLLLEEACKDWSSNLLFTNYALESKAVYDKSGKFDLLSTKKGRRYYLRPSLSILLPSRSSFLKHSSFALKLIDFIFGLINPIPLLTKMISLGRKVEFEYLSRPENEVSEMFESVCSATPTRRSRFELQWILRFPWLVSSPMGDRIGKKYYFSSSPSKFCQTIVKVFNNDNLVGFIIFNINGGKLTVPYISFNPEDSTLMAKVILLHALKFKVSLITIYNEDLVKAINRIGIYKWFSKKRIRNYFAAKELTALLKGRDIVFNDGDGDCAFI